MLRWVMHGLWQLLRGCSRSAGSGCLRSLLGENRSSNRWGLQPSPYLQPLRLLGWQRRLQLSLLLRRVHQSLQQRLAGPTRLLLQLRLLLQRLLWCLQLWLGCRRNLLRFLLCLLLCLPKL
jgi:hypothetical protein